MPTLAKYTETIPLDDGTIILAPILPDELTGSILTDSDILSLAELHNPDRKAARATWRALARSHLGKDVAIGYDKTGAPHVEQGGIHISVSHSRNLVAVMIADRPCGIDVEEKNRHFEQVADRYISSEERLLPQSDHPLFMAALWCAKECAYKYAATPGLDLLRGIRVIATDFDHHRLECRIVKDGEKDKILDLHIMYRKNCLIVHT